MIITVLFLAISLDGLEAIFTSNRVEKYILSAYKDLVSIFVRID